MKYKWKEGEGLKLYKPMTLPAIVHALNDLRKSYAKIPRNITFSQWLTTQLLELKDDRDRYLGRVNALEEWLTEYCDELKKANVYHKNQGIINAINELLDGDQDEYAR